MPAKCSERISNPALGHRVRCLRGDGHDGLHWATATKSGRKFMWHRPDDPNEEAVWGWRD
jgi:hypothetical protein